MCGGTFVAPPGAMSVVCPYCRQPVVVPMAVAVPVGYVMPPPAVTSESRRSWAVGLFAVAVVAMLVGTLTRSWLTMGRGDDEARLGLLGMEECNDGRCKTEDYDAEHDSVVVVLGSVGKIAVAGTLALIGVLAWTGARVLGRKPAIGPSVAGTVIAALAAMGATMWMITLKNELHDSLEIGWSYALYVVGAVSGLVGCTLARPAR
jgi:hypothetical protein